MMRSLLFLPGNSPSMLINGDLLGSDSIIIDLEDAVSPDDKDAARILVRNALASFATAPQWWCASTGWTPATGGRIWRKLSLWPPNSFCCPRRAAPRTCSPWTRPFWRWNRPNSLTPGGIRVIALVETAVGVEHAYEIASACPRVAAWLWGRKT